MALLIWGLIRAYRAFLWKVGRRLAFSYFLLGVLPIPLLLLLLALLAYLLSGFFLGHLYRDAVQSMQGEIAAAAAGPARRLRRRRAPPPGRERGDRLRLLPQRPEARRRPAAARRLARLAGAARARSSARGTASRPSPASSRSPAAGPPWRRRPRATAAAWWPSTPATSTASSAGAPRCGPSSSARTIPTSTPRASRSAGAGCRCATPARTSRRPRRRASSSACSRGQRYWDAPLVWWGEISGPLLDLASGRRVADYVAVNLNATPNTVLRHLFSSAAEIDALAWLTLLIVGFLLFDVYAAAALMAGFMIFGLSRAVNRLSRGTEAVRRGDFGVRIPVRRRDQVGDLQRSFNEMAGNLETLVATAAQKESLEKELELARKLQNSLLPSDLPAGGGIEFATLFEPSAAIGGDYFDVLRLADDELAVIIADVSGHGLSSGLRMAMLKAALLILVEETREPEEILGRLDAVVRSNRERRFFVTATLGLFNLRTGTLRLTNAGHPPTYRVPRRRRRRDRPPQLAARRPRPRLRQGDAAARAGGLRGLALRRPDRGHQRRRRALRLRQRQADPGRTTARGDRPEIRDRLLAAVDRHTAGHPLGDDRTLMVMRWGGDRSRRSSRSS